MTARAKALAEPKSSGEFLRLSLEANSPAGRARFARLGLSQEDLDEDPEVQVLLLRQLYMAHLQSRKFAAAVEVAEQMVSVGVMRHLAHHDLARAEAARGNRAAAILAQRAACRFAPPDQRSFHWWNLGTLQHFDADFEGALRSLKHAERWSHRDRTLIRAHRAYVMLDQKRVPHELQKIVSDLAKGPAREGYGQFLLGMLAFHLGDKAKASAYLRAYLRRNAGADAAKSASLAEEFRRARGVLASLESD